MSRPASWSLGPGPMMGFRFGLKICLGFFFFVSFFLSPKRKTESMKTIVPTFPILLNLCRNVLRMKCMIFLAKAPILNSLRGFYLDAELMHGIFLAGFLYFLSFPYLCNKKVDIFTRNANKGKGSCSAVEHIHMVNMYFIFIWWIYIYSYIQCLYIHIVNAYSQCIVNAYSGIIVSKKDHDNNMDGLWCNCSSKSKEEVHLGGTTYAQFLQ